MDTFHVLNLPYQCGFIDKKIALLINWKKILTLHSETDLWCNWQHV
ncbi:MAG: hypothetical protein JWN78_2918 [Bacteroidota bacterium]|nr:hypothetical protein [Bacteroidota bacterium]